jgi:hypothetical protein
MILHHRGREPALPVRPMARPTPRRAHSLPWRVRVPGTRAPARPARAPVPGCRGTHPSGRRTRRPRRWRPEGASCRCKQVRPVFGPGDLLQPIRFASGHVDGRDRGHDAPHHRPLLHRPTHLHPGHHADGTEGLGNRDTSLNSRSGTVDCVPRSPELSRASPDGGARYAANRPRRMDAPTVS